MSPSEIKQYLSQLIASDLKHAVMLWGKPGIGKSSIVMQVCQEHNLQFIDLRLSQIMPSDLRGIPVPQEGITHWFPPSFLPTNGKGILFLDELNMAPPALQGVAQQLVLDRRVGEYTLPDHWFVWAAGNRKSDRAAVYDMPAPLANRFIHLSADESLDEFKQYAYSRELNEDVIGFLSLRPDLLHRVHPSEPSWPSPRTWEIAASLHDAEMAVEPAVGAAAAIEFNAYCQLKSDLPDIDAILKGKGPAMMPSDPSVRYATIVALVSRSRDVKQAVNALNWLIQVADEEWIHLYASDLFPLLRERKQYAAFAKLVVQDLKMQAFLANFVALVS